MATETKKCAHAACSCPAIDGKKYCSDYCRDAGSMLELTCQCHHAGCQGEALHH